MLILLPPSEGKAAPRRGAPLDLEALDLAALTAARRHLLDHLISASANDPAGTASARDSNAHATTRTGIAFAAGVPQAGSWWASGSSGLSSG